MEVTGVIPLTKTKWKVELDGTFAFVLYKGELSRFGIETGSRLSEETYEQIRREVILKRAKLRALHLLTDMARSEAGLREKLQMNLYPDDIIEETIAYVKSFGYLNDSSFAESFAESRKRSKSKKEIYALLCAKGISKEEISRALEKCYEDFDEKEAIRSMIRKKNPDITHAEEKDRQKLYAYFSRKGFHYEDIRQVIQDYNENA